MTTRTKPHRRPAPANRVQLAESQQPPHRGIPGNGKYYATSDPAHSIRDETDVELFGEVEHPIGYVEMHASRTVTAGAHSEAWVKGPRSGQQSTIQLTISRNIAGAEDLMLDIDCSDIRYLGQGMLDVTPEALVGLAVLLPRAVEMARREGLLTGQRSDGSGIPQPESKSNA
jgi:hypothetical protein